MDKLNEMFTWLILAAFGCWFAKNENLPVGDKCDPEMAPAAGPAIPEAATATLALTEKPYNDHFHEGSVISAGLSELLNRRKIRRNMLRRKEDLPVTK